MLRTKMPVFPLDGQTDFICSLKCLDTCYNVPGTILSTGGIYQ